MIAPHKRAFYESLTLRAARQRDVDFLLALYQQHARKTPLSALDIAGGTGDYARLLANSGLRVIGLQTDPHLLQLAQDFPREGESAIHWQLGDLRHFAVDPPVDLAFCSRDHITQLLSNEDLLRHFNAVANALTPDGLYIIELPHPRSNPLLDQTPSLTQAEQGDISVVRAWPVGECDIDFSTSVIHASEELSVADHGCSLSQRTAAARRILSVQDIRLLALQTASMRLVAVYGAFDMARPLDNTAASQQLIAVLQKADIPLSYLSPKLEVRPSQDKGNGFGVFARQKIKRDELLIAYGGHVLTRDQLRLLQNDPHRYSLQIEEDLFLTSIGTLADYVNHSCDPNTGMAGATMLAAMRDIEPGEEICWDYAMSDGSPYDEFICTCDAAACRKKVTGDDWQIPALWQRYAGCFSPYLQRRIDLLRAQQKGNGA